MPRRNFSPAEIRSHAASLARREARCAEGDGDPEAAGRFRDLARQIDRMRLTADVAGIPERSNTL